MQLSTYTTLHGDAKAVGLEGFHVGHIEGLALLVLRCHVEKWLLFVYLKQQATCTCQNNRDKRVSRNPCPPNPRLSKLQVRKALWSYQN